MCFSTVRESKRTGGRSPFVFEDPAAFRELYEGFRGGRGGTLIGLTLGGESRLMSGAEEAALVARPSHAR